MDCTNFSDGSHLRGLMCARFTQFGANVKFQCRIHNWREEFVERFGLLGSSMLEIVIRVELLQQSLDCVFDYERSMLNCRISQVPFRWHEPAVLWRLVFQGLSTWGEAELCMDVFGGGSWRRKWQPLWVRRFLWGHQIPWCGRPNYGRRWQILVSVRREREIFLGK